LVRVSEWVVFTACREPTHERVFLMFIGGGTIVLILIILLVVFLVRR
jgi:flagellar biogenesis protein FliO